MNRLENNNGIYWHVFSKSWLTNERDAVLFLARIRQKNVPLLVTDQDPGRCFTDVVESGYLYG